MKKGRFLLLISFVLLASCNYTKLKTADNDLNEKMSLPQEELQKLSYNYIMTKVFAPKCISCHGDSGGISLETYSSILANVSKIKNSVFVEQTMPKKSALSEEQKKLLWNWIEMGAPQFPVDPEDPGPDPLLPTFDSINSKIFVPKCISCHAPGEQAQNILLTKEELLNSPYELVIPNNPDESGLVITLERDDDKRMPPAKDGYASLKDEEKAAIRKWIENGLKMAQTTNLRSS